MEEAFVRNTEATQKSSVSQQLTRFDRACRDSTRLLKSGLRLFKPSSKRYESGQKRVGRKRTASKSRKKLLRKAQGISRSKLQHFATDVKFLKHLTNLAAALRGSEGEEDSNVAVVDQVADSNVLTFVLAALDGVSFADACSWARFYSAIFQLISAMCQPGTGELLFQNPPFENSNVFASVKALNVQAAIYTKIVHLSKPRTGKENLLHDIAATPHKRKHTYGKLNRRKCHPEEDNSGSQKSEWDAMLAHQIMDLTDRLEDFRSTAYWMSEDGIEVHDFEYALQLSTNQDNIPDKTRYDDAQYEENLQSLQVAFAPELASRHSFLGANDVSIPSTRMLALGQEVASLQSVLPLASSASIFVRLDEEQPILWQVLITGPEGTPYADGCFLFDVYFPPSYPSVPPEVKFRTTGGGSVRFNPSLSSTGRVSLPLLDSWNRDKAEVWSPGISSALQVLASIQSLIFVQYPYFNEPGFHSLRGKPEGERKSSRYNMFIQQSTVKHGMIECLKHPPPGFKEVVQAHFKMKKEVILARLREWEMNMDKQKLCDFKEHVQELEMLLNK